jgi:hypothetical protein
MIDTATFITVLPIRIVTNNLPGCSRRESTYFKIRGLPLNWEFIFLLSSEKRATSDPEKKADVPRKKIIAIILKDQSISNQHNA